MEAIVKKWGNSLGVKLPIHIVRELSLRDGSSVKIEDHGNEIIIKPMQKEGLSELIHKINKQNIHKEVEILGPVGKEICHCDFS